MISPHSYIVSGVELGPSLPDQDVSGQNELAIVALDAQTFRLGIATVTGRTDPFLMSHEMFLS
jgi:hypothetical protein